MSATTLTPVFIPEGRDLSFGGVLRSEWIKLRTVRSTWWCFAILIALTIALGIQMSSALTFYGVEGVIPQVAVQAMAVYGITVSTDFGALIVSTLGVLIIAGEYGTGMIRSTLTAVPKRLPALLAKGLVFGSATFVVSVLAFGLTVPLSVAFFAGNGVEVDLGDTRYWLSLLGGVGYLVFVGLIAFGLGAIIRNTAGGIAVALGLNLAAPLVLGAVSGITQAPWLQNVQYFLPSNAGRVLFGYPANFADPFAPYPPATDGIWVMDAWQGGLVLVAWVVVLFSVAAVLLKRRDA